MSNCENFRNAVVTEPRVFGPHPSHIQTPVGMVPTTQTSAPPPLPPRPNAQQTQQTQQMMYRGNMYNNGYNNGGYNGYPGGYPGYGQNPYMMNGHNGYGMNGYGPRPGMFGGNNDPETRFIELAEESTRSAFQSIEALVLAMSNIATMLDSTFFAMTSSFRAVLGVAANFGRLRGVFSQLWSTFALIRSIQWLYRK